MIERIIAASLKQRLLVIVGVLLLVGLGIHSCPRPADRRLSRRHQHPGRTPVVGPGLSPLEVEKFVTYPLEMAMRGLPRLSQLRSISRFGLSVITVVFEDGVDVYFARQLVLERMIEAKEKVPAGRDRPRPRLDGHGRDLPVHARRPARRRWAKVQYLTDLRTIQDWTLAPLLKSVPGVNEVNSFGGYIKLFEVVVDPDKLLKFDLSLKEVGGRCKRTT